MPVFICSLWFHLIKEGNSRLWHQAAAGPAWPWPWISCVSASMWTCKSSPTMEHIKPPMAILARYSRAGCKPWKFFTPPFLLQCVVIHVQMWWGGGVLERLADGWCLLDMLEEHSHSRGVLCRALKKGRRRWNKVFAQNTFNCDQRDIFSLLSLLRCWSLAHYKERWVSELHNSGAEKEQRIWKTVGVNTLLLFGRQLKPGPISQTPRRRTMWAAKSCRLDQSAAQAFFWGLMDQKKKKKVAVDT